MRACRRVAPLAGSVDRNLKRVRDTEHKAVAPLAGSVDRNVSGQLFPCRPGRRSPRGERG